MTTLRVNSTARNHGSPFESLAGGNLEILDELNFQRTIAIERKRTERSKEPFLLVLLEANTLPVSESLAKALDGMATTLRSSSRETDAVGWYKDKSAVGVLFTGLVITGKDEILNTIASRVKISLQGRLKFDGTDEVSISFHFYPDDWNHNEPGRPIDSVLYPDLLSSDGAKASMKIIKRTMDIIFSALAIILCTPLFYAIGLAIKVSSRGPILFRQTRVGQYGKRFTLLKFRSMEIGNDRSVHKKFVQELIANELSSKTSDGKVVYKLTNDQRVTRVGKFLRRTSMDELPQFMNVLLGDMSLVGPRPAIRYEIAAYQTWHRRRVLDLKPGITGLWQVNGRSSVRFDEMVRLDLRYAASWSPWLDLKILLQTPLAVIRGKGAC